jgi:thiol-disulfide isomerase/thioredoxin
MMVDLVQQLRRIEQNPTPELWDEIGSRSTSTLVPGKRPVRAAERRPSSATAWVAAAVAIALAIGSFLILTDAFSGTKPIGPGGHIELIPSPEAGAPIIISGPAIGRTLGAEIRPNDYLGRVTVVTVWATWCGPCLKGMSVISQLQRANPNAAFIGVIRQDSDTAVPPKVSLPSVADASGQLATSLGVTGLPTYLVLDPEGRIRFTSQGGPPSASTLQTVITELQKPVASPGAVNSSSLRCPPGVRIQEENIFGGRTFRQADAAATSAAENQFKAGLILFSKTENNVGGMQYLFMDPQGDPVLLISVDHAAGDGWLIAGSESCADQSLAHSPDTSP